MSTSAESVKAAPPSGAFGRGGFSYEAPAPRGTDGFYVSDGAGEPYSAGRGERDDAFRYYSRHPLPRVGAPTSRRLDQGQRASDPPVVSAMAPQASIGSQVSVEPVAMTCMQCHGGACMYQSPSSEPFCVDCNRTALQM